MMPARLALMTKMAMVMERSPADLAFSAIQAPLVASIVQESQSMSALLRLRWTGSDLRQFAWNAVAVTRKPNLKFPFFESMSTRFPIYTSRSAALSNKRG